MASRTLFSEEQIDCVYDLAKLVHSGELAHQQAVSALADRIGMAGGTAGAYIGAAVPIRNGNGFWRTVSTRGL